jgi:hypothetical protein
VNCVEHIKRLLWVGIGVGFMLLALWADYVSPLRRVMIMVCGLFFLYCGVMYYLPRYRRKREELDKLIDEWERDLK